MASTFHGGVHIGPAAHVSGSLRVDTGAIANAQFKVFSGTTDPQINWDTGGTAIQHNYDQAGVNFAYDLIDSTFGMFRNVATGRAHYFRVNGANVAQIDATGFDCTIIYKVNGTKVVGARGAAVADAFHSAAAPTKAEFDALVDTVNSLLARLRATTGHGLIA